MSSEAEKVHLPTTKTPQIHHEKTTKTPLKNTHFSQKPLQKRIQRCRKKYQERRENGGGGGSRTHVRKNFQQRAFMLFPVHFCLVIAT
jgi:hypothetical protein